MTITPKFKNMFDYKKILGKEKKIKKNNFLMFGFTIENILKKIKYN